MSTEKTVIPVAPANVRNRSDDNEGEGDADSAKNPFSQERKEWATALDDETESYLCEYYGVQAHEVYDLEGAFDGEYDPSDALRAFQILDFAGLDKIVDCGDRIITIAQRVRPTSGTGTDFSFRTSNGMGRPSEHTKLTTAVAQGGFVPDAYAFGIVNEAEDAFERFYLIDTRQFVMALNTGRIEGEGPYTTRQGPEGPIRALYFPVADLVSAGLILDSWGDVQ